MDASIIHHSSSIIIVVVVDSTTCFAGCGRGLANTLNSLAFFDVEHAIFHVANVVFDVENILFDVKNICSMLETTFFDVENSVLGIENIVFDIESYVLDVENNNRLTTVQQLLSFSLSQFVVTAFVTVVTATVTHGH